MREDTWNADSLLPPFAPAFTDIAPRPNFVPGAEHDPSGSLTLPNATYDVFPIPVLAADFYIKVHKCKELWLTSLTMTLDPDLFSSTYERKMKPGPGV